MNTNKRGTRPRRTPGVSGTGIAWATGTSPSSPDHARRAWQVCGNTAGAGDRPGGRMDPMTENILILTFALGVFAGALALGEIARLAWAKWRSRRGRKAREF